MTKEPEDHITLLVNHLRAGANKLTNAARNIEIAKRNLDLINTIPDNRIIRISFSSTQGHGRNIEINTSSFARRKIIETITEAVKEDIEKAYNRAKKVLDNMENDDE